MFVISDQISYKVSFIKLNRSASTGAQFVPIGMPTVCWNTRLPHWTNILPIEFLEFWKHLLYIWKMIWNIFFIRYQESLPITIHLYLGVPSFYEKQRCIMFSSMDFNLSMGNKSIKCWKIIGFHAIIFW